MARSNPFAKGKYITVPKGKKKGDIFTKGNKRYLVVSYVTSTGKRIRQARPVSGIKASTAKRGHKAPARTTSGSIAIPKGKKKGDIFKRGSSTYKVVSFVSSTGKRVRFARKQ